MLFVCSTHALTYEVGVAAKQLAAGRGCLVGVKLSARSKKDYSLSIYCFTFSADAGISSLPIVFYTFCP